MNLRQNFEAIVERVRDRNTNNEKDPIPTSETAYRRIMSDLAESSDRLEFMLRLLSEAHYIFTIKIVEADENLMISGIYGYIAAEIPIVAKLKERYFRELELAYSSQFYNRKQAAAIMRELVGDARRFNNTPLGNALNICVMLQQYEHFISTNFAEFSETWKKNKLSEIMAGMDPNEAGGMEDSEVMQETPGEGGMAEAADTPARAVDTAEYARMQEMDTSGKWGSAVNKFGVEFLLRIHFRKYEFEEVRQLVRTKKIAKEEDLRYVRDTLRKMESRVKTDPGLAPHLQTMAELRRMVQIRLNKIFMIKKEMGG